MEKIYIAFVDTPGIFAGILHRYLSQKYIHVVVSMDAGLEEAYSFGRRNPAIPIVAGFEREEKEKILAVYPNASYCIGEIVCTKEQKEEIQEELRSMYERRFSYHYAVTSLPYILCHKAHDRENRFTCSSFLAYLFRRHGIVEFAKADSLVTPKDFYEWDGYETIFEGRLEEICHQQHIPYTYSSRPVFRIS